MLACEGTHLAVLSGRTAAWLHGLDLSPCEPIEITLPTGSSLPAGAGLSVRRASLQAGEVGWRRQMPATSPLRTVIDLGSRPPLVEAVVALDMALHRRLVKLAKLQDYVETHPRSLGIARLRRALELAEPATESPMETRLRLLLVLAGLPRPQAQVSLYDDRGRLLGRPDLLYPAQRLGLEYDGVNHRDRLVDDNRRQNRLHDAGYHLLRFTAADINWTPGAVVALVARQLCRQLIWHYLEVTRMVGFVYVMTNLSFPDLVKVGHSKQLPEDRAQDLSRTAVPFPFDIARRALTSYPAAVERRAQDLLAEYRVRADREFFRTTPEVAFNAIQRALLEESGIQAWNTEEPVRLRAGDRVALTIREGQFFVVLPYGPLTDEPETVDVWQAHSNGDLLELMAVDSSERTAGFSTGDPGGDADPVPYLNRTDEAVNGTIIGRERLEPGQRLLWLDGAVVRPACAMAMFELDAYCQVTCRTWSEQFDASGFPLLLNVMTEQPTELMAAVVRSALRMKPPDLSPMPHRTPEDDALFGNLASPPEFWLAQLTARSRRTKKK